MKNVRSGNTRLVAVALFLLVTGLLAGVLAPALFATDVETEPPREYSVKEGDTLWSLARTFAPNVDPRRFIYELRRLNGLPTSSIYPGQRLILPNF
jgi:nucleoid-associated protein YgaU